MKNLAQNLLLKKKKGKPGRKKKEKLDPVESSTTVVSSDIKTDSSEPIQETPEVSTSVPVAETPTTVEETIAEPKKEEGEKKVKKHRKKKEKIDQIAVAATLSDVGPSSAARAQRARKRKSLKDTNKGDTKLTGTLRACQSLLRILMDHKHAWPFNQPVDPVSLQILDYFDIIKNPMDFSTIKEQLEDGIYDAPEEFATDIRLVFKNAFTYNQAGSDICVMAENLQNLFEKKFAKLGKRTEEDGMESTINEIRDSMKYVREEIRKLKETKRGAPAAEVTKRGRPPAQEDERPMTLDEKKSIKYWY